MRKPSKNVADLQAVLTNVVEEIEPIIVGPRFEIKIIEKTVEASSSIDFELSASTLGILFGVIQISSTAIETPVIQFKNTRSRKVSYTFGASTSGKQKFVYLLVGE